MLLITIPLMIILAITAFLFNNFYKPAPEGYQYSSSGNFMLYHQAMYSYAISQLATFSSTPRQLNSTTGTNPYTLGPVSPYTIPPYFESNTVNFEPVGDYVTQVLTYNNNVKYIVSSFNVIKANSTYALKTINAIAKELETPDSGTSQNYRVQVALINNGCNVNPTILNSDLNNNNVVNSNYQTIFKSICSAASGAGYTIKTYVLMEALQ